jgi:hypothetical protein
MWSPWFDRDLPEAPVAERAERATCKIWSGATATCGRSRSTPEPTLGPAIGFGRNGNRLLRNTIEPEPLPGSAGRCHRSVPPESAAILHRDDVERRVWSDLGHRIIGWTELGTGTNNRLFRLDLASGPSLLAKFYLRDRWDRLGIEFQR